MCWKMMANLFAWCDTQALLDAFWDTGMVTTTIVEAHAPSHQDLATSTCLKDEIYIDLDLEVEAELESATGTEYYEQKDSSSSSSYFSRRLSGSFFYKEKHLAEDSETLEWTPSRVSAASSSAVSEASCCSRALHQKLRGAGESAMVHFPSFEPNRRFFGMLPSGVKEGRLRCLRGLDLPIPTVPSVHQLQVRGK